MLKDKYTLNKQYVCVKCHNINSLLSDNKIYQTNNSLEKIQPFEYNKT